jgi:PAS domain S-box-containing protein
MGQSGVVRSLPNVASLSWDDCRLLVESVVDYAIFMLDTGGHVATWNLGAERIKGYSAAEIIGEHFSKFYLPEDVAAGKPELELSQAAALGRIEDEGWRVRKDGTRLWANVILTALRDERGNLRGFAKVTRDMTAKRAAEQKLRASEQRFHHLVDAVMDYAIFMLDQDGLVATWNAGARATKGYAPEEIIGRHFSVFYTAEDRAAGRPDHILAEVRRTGRFEDESWRVRKDGTRFWANVVITALRDEHGELIGFAKVTRDLTDRRRTEEELRRSEERFRALMESVTDYAIYVLDVDGRVATWNSGAERMKGYAASEILGKSFAVFFSEEDVRNGKPARELEIARTTGRFEEEGWRTRKDGTRFWANVVVTPLRDAHRQLIGFSKITRDLTARREAEETERALVREQIARVEAERTQRRLRESEEAAHAAVLRAESAARRAEAASRVKDEFLATVSHELRTPLNAMLGYAALLRKRGASDPAMQKPIDAIHRNAQAQARLIEDILDVSRIVTGKLRLDPLPTDLTVVVNEAIDVVRPSSNAKDITITFATTSDPAVVIGDHERLRQVAWNLLSNSVKFTDVGGAIEVGIERKGGEILLSVHDTGRGIAPEFLPYVFDRFNQADSSTTRAVGGLGLGLAIVRHIVELHGGQVRAESEGAGKGARFCVTLPIRGAVDVDPARISGQPVDVAPSPAIGALSGLCVLVVDDDADARELVRELLVDAGAFVDTATDAISALAAIRRLHPHVLVSDIAMPGEDGYSLAERVRALPADEGGHIPSVALTAYTRAEDRAKALAAGFTTHIGKPVDPEHLIATVASVVGRR